MQAETRRYTFKLYPNKAQGEAFERQSVLLARLWNAALQEREDQWRREVERKGHWRKVPRPKEDKPQGLSYYDQARAIKTIRRDDPEYAEMSCASLELCLKALDLAFKAFWRRLKEGCDPGAAGYPRYKSTKRHRTIWHRDRSGWKMTPRGKHWQFYFKGVPGLVKARGRFPCGPGDIRTMEIIERDGRWQASVVVRQRRRIESGTVPLTVHFDLLDKFAVVKNAANGECLPGLTPVFEAGEGRIILANNGDGRVSLGTDDGRCQRSLRNVSSADDAPDGGRKGQKRPAADDATELRGTAGSPDMNAQNTADALQSARDRRFKKFSYRWRRETKRIARRKAKEARIRREALHRWTTLVVRSASEITVIAPPVKESTKSGRGDKYEWGGAVKAVAALNRHTLSQAPALAIQMLEYKAREAGIGFNLVTDEKTDLAAGRLLTESVKANRKLKRSTKDARRKAA